MARSIDTDPLLTHNWALVEVPVPAIPPLAFPFKTAQSVQDKSLVSFQSIEVPDTVLNTRKIQEGNWPFTHTVLMTGAQTGQVRIRQAVTPINLDFFIWISQAMFGFTGSAPRRHFVILHLRSDHSIPRREIFLWDCIPVSWTPSTSLDGSKSEVALEEIVLECGHIEVLPGVP